MTESIKDRVEELEEKSPPRPSGTSQEGNKYKDDGGEMQDSELGPIPKGWRVGKLGEILKLSNETINQVFTQKWNIFITVFPPLMMVVFPR